MFGANCSRTSTSNKTANLVDVSCKQAIDGGPVGYPQSERIYAVVY